MPTLPNPRHEALAIARSKGESAAEAYANAGFKPNRFNAATLCKKQHILERVAELLAAVAQQAGVTIESVCKQLDEDRALAHQNGQAGAAVAASMAKAKLHGLTVERSVVQTHNHHYEKMDAEELRLEIAAIIAEAKALKLGRAN